MAGAVTATPEDDLLAMLLSNLRNAAASYGEGSVPYDNVRVTIKEHLQSMQAKGLKTNLTAQVAAAQAKTSQMSDLFESMALNMDHRS